MDAAAQAGAPVVITQHVQRRPRNVDVQVRVAVEDVWAAVVGRGSLPLAKVHGHGLDRVVPPRRVAEHAADGKDARPRLHESDAVGVGRVKAGAEHQLAAPLAPTREAKLALVDTLVQRGRHFARRLNHELVGHPPPTRARSIRPRHLDRAPWYDQWAVHLAAAAAVAPNLETDLRGLRQTPWCRIWRNRLAHRVAPLVDQRAGVLSGADGADLLAQPVAPGDRVELQAHAPMAVLAGARAVPPRQQLESVLELELQRRVLFVQGVQRRQQVRGRRGTAVGVGEGGRVEQLGRVLGRPRQREASGRGDR